MVVQRLHTAQGVGSNPTITTSQLGYDVMVALRILIPSVGVRVPIPLPYCGVHSVVACTLLCESGSTGSIPVGHPNAALADVVIATV